MKLHGNETAIVNAADLLFKIGKLHIYRVYMTKHTRIFILDHEIKKRYTDGLKRLPNTDKYFINIGGEK